MAAWDCNCCDPLSYPKKDGVFHPGGKGWRRHILLQGGKCPSPDGLCVHVRWGWINAGFRCVLRKSDFLSRNWWLLPVVAYGFVPEAVSASGIQTGELVILLNGTPKPACRVLGDQCRT